VAIIGSSTLSLQVELSPPYHEAGELISMRAFLQDQGQPMRDAQQVGQLTVRAEVTTPQKETVSLVLAPHSAGVFAATLPALQMPGEYALIVTATSPTLQRPRPLSFTLHPLCFQTTVSSAPPMMARLLLSDACPFLWHDC